MDDNESMNNKFKYYRSQILFIGLDANEMMKIEVAFNKYSVFYKDSISKVQNLDAYDLIYIDEKDYSNYQELVATIQKPFFIIGDKKVLQARGNVKKPLSVRECLESVYSVIPPAKTPEILPLEVGAIVRSKTTPQFGKGIVVSILSENEVSVKFPKSNFISKAKDVIRCHKSQLQIIGSVEEILNKETI